MSTPANPVATLPPPPPSVDPNAQGAPDNPITSVPRSTSDKIGGVLSGILKAAGGNTSQMDQNLQQHYDQRMAEAKMNQQHTQLYGTILAHAHQTASAQAPYGIDPTTGQAMTKEQYDYYTNAYNSSMAAYEKSAGVNKQSKGMIQRAKMVMGHIVGSLPGQTPGAGAQKPGMPAPPQSSAAGGGGSAPAGNGASNAPATSAGPAFPPPPASMLQQGLDDSRERQKLDEASKRKIAEEQAKPVAFKTMERHVQGNSLPPGILTMDGSLPDPDKTYDLIQTGDPSQPYIAGPSGATSAELTPKWFNYVGPDGKPHRGFTIGGPGNAAAYSADGEKLDMDPEVFSAWMQPRTTITDGFKSEVQPDGSTKLVPVQTASTQYRGTKGTSTAAPATAPAAPAPAPSSGTTSGPAKKSSGGGGARVLGPGTTVGGKAVPANVKAYETFNGAQERYAVMADAFPKALQGNQQAALNLLANHIGMTMGLQKGARITQAIYNEAMESSPVGGRIEAHFTGPADPVTGEPTLDLNPLHYRQGVVLTPDQMTQMIDLAKVRLAQDKAAWQRTVKASKTGFTSEGDSTSPPASGNKGGMPKPPASTPKTWEEVKKQAAAAAASSSP